MAGWVGREGYYPVPSQTLPGPIFSLLLASEPYLRPNEGLFSIFYEVSEIGSRIDLRYASEWTQNDLRIDPPDDPQTGLQMALRSLISRPQISYAWK